MPLTVGGGWRTVDDIRKLLIAARQGLDQHRRRPPPGLVAEAARKFGSQCIVVAIDAKAAGPAGSRSSPMAGAAGRASTPWPGRGA